jgi:hypothetical protein
MITWEQSERRIERLERLGLGLAREDMLWTKDNLHDHPPLFAETRAYLEAIRDALSGVETARVVLAKATQRKAARKRGGREGGYQAGAGAPTVPAPPRPISCRTTAGPTTVGWGPACSSP